MRIILLRVLIAWWAIPCLWVVLAPFAILMEGKPSVQMMIGLTKDLWNGV